MIAHAKLSIAVERALGAEHRAERSADLTVGRRHAPRQQQEDEAMRGRWRSVQSDASAATDAPPKSRHATDEAPLLHCTLTNRYHKKHRSAAVPSAASVRLACSHAS